MEKRRRNAIILFVLSNLAALAAVFLYLLFMSIYDAESAEPICNFQRIFHIYCPGCGGSRSLRALVRLDLVSSFICFPPLPLSLPILGYAEYLLVRGIIDSDARRILKFKPWILIIPAAMIILNFLARNVLLLNGIDVLGDIL